MTRAHSRRTLVRVVAGLCAAGAGVRSAGEEVSEATRIGEWIADLESEDPRRRDRAEERLVETGDAALPFLPVAEDEPGAELAWRIERVEFRIRWRLSAPLLRELGGLFDDYERLPAARRMERLQQLVRFGGSLALPALLAAKDRDRDPVVRRAARRLAGELDVSVRSRAARAALAAGDPDGALRIVQESLEVDSENPQVHYEIGRVAARAGRFEEAIAAIDRAISLGFTHLYALEEDPDLAGLWKDPRFRELVRTRLEDSR